MVFNSWLFAKQIKKNTLPLKRLTTDKSTQGSLRVCTELAGSSDNWPGYVVPCPLAWASHMGGVLSLP